MKTKDPHLKRFTRERRLMICRAQPCRRSCHCKGYGFYYSMTIPDEALMRESFKKKFREIDPVRFENA